MTQDEIIEMWKNSGDLEIIGMPYSKIEAFAKLVAAKEREACAKFVEEEYTRQFETPWRHDLSQAIRARSNSRGEA